MRIRDWPILERPREKLVARGAPALSDAELVAIFLGSGLRGQDAVETARTLLNAHGSLRALLDQPIPLMEGQRGIGRARACLLTAAIELGSRFYAATLDRGEPMAEPGVAGDYFHRKLRGHASETFAAMFLDGRLRMIGFEELFTGTVDKAEIYPRELCRRALACNASAVIVGHNHPSGTPDPSNADREATLELRRVLKCIDVRLLDHIIVGDGPPVSLAARGLL